MGHATQNHPLPKPPAGRLSPRQALRQGRHQLDQSADGPGEPRSGAEAEPRPYLPRPQAPASGAARKSSPGGP